MKKTITLFFLVVGATLVYSQENMVTLSGGYAFANIEDTGTDATGWRINGSYEFNPLGGNWAHGISVGYIRTKATIDIPLSQSVEYKLSAWPVYYAPKFMFGKENAKGFIKGAIGWQWSGIDRSGPVVEGDTNDSGFYGGASLGFMKSFNEKVFVNLEYEWAYLSNYLYRDAFMNSIMLGLGYKF
jgi:hypothetical protein